MRFLRIGLCSLVLACLMSLSAWAQTDSEGRALAWKLYEAYEAGSQGGNYNPFQQLFMQNPQMTRRAFVSTMEYATEIYQQDMNSASQVVAFANQLAQMIAQQFQDNVPASLMQRLMRQDASAMPEFVNYAASLYPGYAQGQGAYGPSGQPGYGPGTQPGYGPGGAAPGYPGAYGPGNQPGYGPGGTAPGAYPGNYGPGQAAPGAYPGGYGPGGHAPGGGYPGGYGPGSQPGYGPGGSAPSGYPGAYGPGPQPGYGPGGIQPGYGPGQPAPGGYPGAYGPNNQPGYGPGGNAPGGYPNNSAPYRPNTTGGPGN